MNNNDLLRRKLEYATPEEVLIIFLNDTDSKFKKAIMLWKDGKAEGTALASKIYDNILELKSTLNTNIGNKETQEALITISNLYSFMLEEITLASLKKDYERLEEVHQVFLNIKRIFEEDRKNLK